MTEHDLFELLRSAGLSEHATYALLARVLTREREPTMNTALRNLRAVRPSTIVVGKWTWRGFVPLYARAPRATLLGDGYFSR